MVGALRSLGGLAAPPLKGAQRGLQQMLLWGGGAGCSSPSELRNVTRGLPSASTSCTSSAQSRGEEGHHPFPSRLFLCPCSSSCRRAPWEAGDHGLPQATIYTTCKRTAKRKPEAPRPAPLLPSPPGSQVSGLDAWPQGPPTATALPGRLQIPEGAKALGSRLGSRLGWESYLSGRNHSFLGKNQDIGFQLFSQSSFSCLNLIKMLTSVVKSFTHISVNNYKFPLLFMSPLMENKIKLAVNLLHLQVQCYLTCRASLLTTNKR